MFPVASSQRYKINFFSNVLLLWYEIYERAPYHFIV